jgi:hypothetical protein
MTQARRRLTSALLATPPFYVINLTHISGVKGFHMQQLERASSEVLATVRQVVPVVGLAKLVADDNRSWAITKSTPGSELEKLALGSRAVLTVTQHPGSSVASAYVISD